MLHVSAMIVDLPPHRPDQVRPVSSGGKRRWCRSHGPRLRARLGGPSSMLGLGAQVKSITAVPHPSGVAIELAGP